MTRNNIFTIMTMTIMMMVSANSYAQGRGGNNGQTMNGNRGGNREMVMNNGDNQMNRGGQMNNSYRGSRNMSGNNRMAQVRGNRIEGSHGQMMNERGMNGGRMMNDNRDEMERGGMMARRGGMPRVDARGFVPGWEGRVMYRNGRWGYLRGADWYWYDTYFEPDFYFDRPLDYFRPHFIPMDGRVATGVAAGVATAVAVSTLISALCH